MKYPMFKILAAFVMAYLITFPIALLSEITYRKKPIKEVFQKQNIMRVAWKLFIGLLVTFIATFLHAIFK
jgi:hypothetical protein